MPKVPVAEQQTDLRPLPSARQESIASGAMFSGGADQQIALGQGLQRGGAQLSEVAVKMQDRENADMIFRAETAFKDDLIKITTEARQRRGANAFNVTDDVDTALTDAAKKHSEGLTNEVQRRIFTEQVTKSQQQTRGTMSQFEWQERRASVVESTTAAVGSTVKLAASAAADGYLNPSPDPNTPSFNIENFRKDIKAHIAVLGQVEGWLPAKRQFEEDKYVSMMHEQVIQNMVDKNPKAAKEYYAANKGEIGGDKRDAIDKLLKVGSLKVTAQTFADEVTAAGMTEQEALTKARAQFEGDEETAAVAEIKTRFAESTQARERMQRDAADEAYKILANRGTVNAIPAALWEKLDGKVQLALKKEQEAKAEGKMPKTDWDKYYALRREAIENPDAFRRKDLRAEFPYLGKAERESLIDLQVKKPEEMKEVATLENQLGNAHDLMKWTGSGNAEKRGRFDTAVQQEIIAAEKGGKKLNYEERQKIIDRLLIQKDSWFSSTRLYEVRGTEDEAKFVPKVPDAEAAKIKAALKRANKPVTDDAVLQLYKKKMGLQ